MADSTAPTLVADHVVVGAGAAGCVLADRLSADGTARVLLLEAGPVSRDPLLQVPKGFIRTMQREAITWRYPTQPIGGAGVETWVRGRTLGGSTAINGAMHAPGEAAHYDELGAALGPDWGWPAWERALGVVEDRLSPEPSALDDDVAPAVLDALAATGAPTRSHLGAGSGPRSGRTLSLVHRGRRRTAASVFLAPARRRPNLRVHPGTTAVRLQLDGDQVTGVLVEQGGQRRQVRARRGVVLCCGALETPQLLERSGIGDPRVLEHAGIEVQVASSRVGEGLVEQRSTTVKTRLRDGLGTGRLLSSRAGIAAQALRYALTRGGPLATGPYEVGALLATDGAVPDVQLLATALATDDTGVAVAPHAGLMIQGFALRPSSRGSLHVTGPSASASPRLDTGILTTDGDRRAAATVLERIRAVLAEPALARLVVAETAPGPGVATPAAAAEHALRSGAGIYHAVGTCAMGRAPAAVVDERLRVRGVSGLHVADTSVFPSPPSGGTASPTMALGVLAADLITKEPA